MKNSPKHKDESQSKKSLPSPSSSITIVQTDRSSFKKVVQMLTGIPQQPNNPKPVYQPDPRFSSFHSLPPIKAVSNKKQSSSFRIYERRNSMKHRLQVNPTHYGLPEIISPSILNFPSLRLSPITPLVSDPFNGASSSDPSPSSPGFGHQDPKLSSDAEERATKEKVFHLLPSPSTTPTDPKPRLLPLFPVTSPHTHEP